MLKSALALLLLAASPVRAHEAPLPRLTEEELSRRSEGPAPAPPAPPGGWDDATAQGPGSAGLQAPPPPAAQAAPGAVPPAAAPTPEAFRRGLAPYGAWVQSPEHGWVWRPRVAGAWRPYDRGHWAWTDAGWTWMSDEPWSWATYRYGRWGYDAGWYWVPGYQWAPAWVTWRYGAAGAIGWGPLTVGLGFPAWGYSYWPRHRFYGHGGHSYGHGGLWRGREVAWRGAFPAGPRFEHRGGHGGFRAEHGWRGGHERGGRGHDGRGGDRGRGGHGGGRHRGGH